METENFNVRDERNMKKHTNIETNLKKYLMVSGLCILILCGCSSKEQEQHSEQSTDLPTEQDQSESDAESQIQLEPDTENQTPENEDTEAVFEMLPSEFTFTDGAGAWYTNIMLNQDGTFTGEYKDYSASDNGEGRFSSFRGKFAELQKIDEYTYSMNLDSLSMEGEIGEEYYEDNIKFIRSEPYGITESADYLIYLPGRPMNEEEMNNLSGSYVGVALYEGIMPSGMYCIYNVDEKAGFSGME